jgi:4-amino-4-deoxy-L-arabinose transferase-like glycosyltransferase
VAIQLLVNLDPAHLLVGGLALLTLLAGLRGPRPRAHLTALALAVWTVGFWAGVFLTASLKPNYLLPSLPAAAALTGAASARWPVPATTRVSLIGVVAASGVARLVYLLWLPAA